MGEPLIFIKVLKEKALKAFHNQDYPFDKLVDELNVKRDIGRTPVFDIMMVFQNKEEVEVKPSLESLEIEVTGKDYVVNKYQPEAVVRCLRVSPSTMIDAYASECRLPCLSN